MENIIKTMNQMHGNIQDDVLNEHLHHVRDFCQPTNPANVQQRTAREVIGMMINILERIIGRPDDSNARKIRLTHPAIQVSISFPNISQDLTYLP